MPQGNEKRSWSKDGFPAWFWPSAITSWAIIERVLGGFKVAGFFELTTHSSNYLPQVLGIVLGGYVGNAWMKKVEERKMVAAENPPAVTQSDPPSALKVTTTATSTS